MLDALRNAWKIPDLRKRIKYTALMLILFRIGTFVPVPRMDPNAVRAMIEKGALLGFFDIISGGAFKQFSVFAMSITPYINASIIVQLLTIVIPQWEDFNNLAFFTLVFSRENANGIAFFYMNFFQETHLLMSSFVFFPLIKSIGITTLPELKI
jgi:preprotein translocase subunit SecY